MCRAPATAWPEALTEMGYAVTTLSGADLTPERLRGLDAVVIGIRAFNVRKDLAPQLPALFAYVEAGGNLIVQYNNPNGLKDTAAGAVRPAVVGSDRVTDETAPVTFLAPDHPVAHTSPTRSRRRISTAGSRSAGFISPANGTSILSRSSPAMTPARRRSRAACWSPRTGKVISSTPDSRGSGSSPRACPAPTGFSPTSFRSENDP